MRCWNCRRVVSDEALFCQYCEADLQVPIPDGAEEFVSDLLESMDDATLQTLRAAFERSENADEFVSRVMIGDCPRCRSSNVDDCENDTRVEDITVGQCLECGFLWCLECGEPLDLDHPDCPHWEVCRQCEEDEGEYGCQRIIADCPRIREWQDRRDGG